MSGATQRRVRATIEQVGGYWRPLAGLARLLEELGELAESEPGSAAAAGELADLWIIATAISDQFLGDVAEPRSDWRVPGARVPGAGGASRAGERVHEQAGEGVSQLLARAGVIARIVNFYDGPKSPRSRAGWPSLGEAVASFHGVLGAVAVAQGVDLAAAVQEKLAAIPARDAERFGRGWQDPSTAPALAELRAGIEGSAALGFEPPRARLWGAPHALEDPRAAAEGLREIAAALVSFTRAAERERLDAYVIPGPRCPSMTDLHAWLATLLGELAALDPGRGEPPAGGLSPRSEGDRAEAPAAGATAEPDTTLVFNGTGLLCTLLSPLFAPEDPRRCASGSFAVLAPVRRAHG